MNVHVFKTSIRPKDKPLVDAILNSILSQTCWTYDLEDCDRVLRVVHEGADIPSLVSERLRENGIWCEELD